MSKQEDYRPQVPTSAMAIASLVLGFVAFITSTLPIINNLSGLLSLLGILFAIIGFVAAMRKTRTGKILAIVALLLNVLAFSMVVSAQNSLSSSFRQAMNGPSVVSVSAVKSSGARIPRASQGTTGDLYSKFRAVAQKIAEGSQEESSDPKVGSTVSLSNGVEVTVDYVDVRTNFDGSEVTAVGVTYHNGATSGIHFNSYDWKGQDGQGVLRDCTFFIGDGTPLNYGELVPGGSVSGEVFFDGSIVKVAYYASIFGEPTAIWSIG